MEVRGTGREERERGRDGESRRADSFGTFYSTTHRRIIKIPLSQVRIVPSLHHQHFATSRLYDFL